MEKLFSEGWRIKDRDATQNEEKQRREAEEKGSLLQEDY
jgi:hypothetical protein